MVLDKLMILLKHIYLQTRKLMFALYFGEHFCPWTIDSPGSYLVMRFSQRVPDSTWITYLLHILHWNSVIVFIKENRNFLFNNKFQHNDN